MNNSTLTFAEIPAEPYFFLRKKLPEGGLDALLKKNVTPVSNAAHSQMMEGMLKGMGSALLMSNIAQVKDFFKVVGKPLAVASDLESRPGVWWMSTADGAYDLVLFSDMHRKNAWKGSQLCITTNGRGGLSIRSVQMLALSKTCEALFDIPTDLSYLQIALSVYSMFDEGQSCVSKALAKNPELSWPVWRPDLPSQDLTVLARAARLKQEGASSPARPFRGY